MWDFFKFNNFYYWLVLILGLILILIIKIYEAKIIGWFGEHWTKKALKKLPKDKYKVLNNIMIFEDNAYCQIDHIVISKHGIFVIETKQYNGHINGSKYDKYWTRKGTKYLYYNPIRQNYGHIQKLKKLLNIDESKFINLVCISSKYLTMKIQHDGEICDCHNIVNKILSYKDVIINDSATIEQKIKEENKKCQKHKKEFINSIKNKKNENDGLVCPRCGGKLVEKEKFNKFLGCSSYPKCKYTRKIKS